MKKKLLLISAICTAASFLFPTIASAGQATLVVTCPAPTALNTTPEHDMISGRGAQAGSPVLVPNILFVFNAGWAMSYQPTNCKNQSVDYVNGAIQCSYTCPDGQFYVNSPWIGQKELSKTIQGANQITLIFQTDSLAKPKK